MRQNSLIFGIVVLAFLITSCVKHYEPVIKSNDAVKYVVSGQVNMGDAVQHINISKTSPISKPGYLSVAGCQVNVVDDKGNSYSASDVGGGDYDLSIPESALVHGASFKVDIVTPDGVNIVSDFDYVNECPEVDSVYFVVKELPTTKPSVTIKGIQFYIDLNATQTASHFFRWEGIETWEYHSTWPIEWYYDGAVHHVYPPDYSKFVCWRTQSVKNIFTLSTEKLSSNEYHFLPLHYVDNATSARLVYGYSLLIRQLALSESAYSYWEKLRINSNEQGGLYEKQPLAIRGNLHNVTHPEQDVLGFFGVSEVKSKRIFVSNVAGLPIDYNPNCTPGEGMRGGFKEIDPADYPAYLDGDHEHFFMKLLSVECVDCLSLGGTTVKPSFWPY